MEKNSSRRVPTLLDPQTTADLLGVSRRTLEDWRHKGTGPDSYRLGHRTVKYDLDSVVSFIRERKTVA